MHARNYTHESHSHVQRRRAKHVAAPFLTTLLQQFTSQASPMRYVTLNNLKMSYTQGGNMVGWAACMRPGVEACVG